MWFANGMLLGDTQGSDAHILAKHTRCSYFWYTTRMWVKWFDVLQVSFGTLLYVYTYTVLLIYCIHTSCICIYTYIDISSTFWQTLASCGIASIPRAICSKDEYRNKRDSAHQAWGYISKRKYWLPRNNTIRQWKKVAMETWKPSKNGGFKKGNWTNIQVQNCCFHTQAMWVFLRRSVFGSSNIQKMLLGVPSGKLTWPLKMAIHIELSHQKLWFSDVFCSRERLSEGFFQ